MSVTIRKDNLSPSLFDTIRIGGVPFDLTGSTVKLRMRLDTSPTLDVDSAATVINAASSLSGQVILPEPAITVVSAAGFLAKGALTIGTQIVEYDEISGNTFLGCRGGEGTIAGGTAVSQRGGVRYDWLAGDVDVAADFTAWWRVTLPSGKSQDTPEFDIVVEDPTAIFRGLCELADVISYAPGYAKRTDTDTDALLKRLILAKTREILRETKLEFVPISSASSVRTFEISSWNAASRKIYISPLASAPTLVRILASDQTTLVQTVAGTDYILQPTYRQSWDPIEAIGFPSGTVGTAAMNVGTVVEITGVWGYPSVPDDIREACAMLVVSSYAMDAANAGTLLAESLATVNVGVLFASARRVVDGYRPILEAWA